MLKRLKCYGLFPLRRGEKKEVLFAQIVHLKDNFQVLVLRFYFVQLSTSSQRLRGKYCSFSCITFL